VFDLPLMLMAGVLAGFVGALLGIGGGVLLVPLLNATLGLSIPQAAAISNVGVLATAGSVAVSSATRQRLNVRLAVTLLVFSVAGAMFGASLLKLLDESDYKRIFGVSTAVIAALMLTRLDKRNIKEVVTDTGVLGGRFFDEDTGETVAYHVVRLPVAAIVSTAAGMLATLIGIGGGIVIVPVLNSLCGVPMRVAAATSAFMIGVTTVPAVIARWDRGELGDFHLAAGTALGVFAGYQLGIWLSTRAPVRSLKLVMAVILSVVAVRYLVWA
jgi:uncharacterized protein